MQHKPRFSGIIIAAVLMVAALVMISSYSSLFASSKSTMMLSEAMGYFESNQVTYFNLDLNTGVIEMSVKEGEHPLPESGTSSETSNGLLAEIYGDGTDAYAPKNGGAAVITYKLPYPSYFLQFYLKDYIDQYNAANPDAPMQYDMVAVKNNVPWFEIILYAFMIGSVVLLFMSMYRGGAGGGGLMNVGRAKVKDQQEGQRKATFADVAGADEEKAELQEVVQFLKAPEKFNSLGARIPHGVLLVGPPGTGKTLLARACAGEAGVPFYAISGSDFVEMYVGVGASRVRDLFETAKKNVPCIIFIDEIDKIAGGANHNGPDVSREGVQRDILPIVEGCTVNTKYGSIKTDYILFVASGAFHISSVSDLIPELQGRFPVVVELNSLNKEDFVKILTEPENAVTVQYQKLLAVDNIELCFTPDGIDEIAGVAVDLNTTQEDIGARRLQALLEHLLEEVSFNVDNGGEKVKVTVDKKFVNLTKETIAQNLRKYIL